MINVEHEHTEARSMSFLTVAGVCCGTAVLVQRYGREVGHPGVAFG